MNNSISRAIQQAISYQFQSLGIVCPVPAGTWNATTSYQKLNIVRTAHASYIAKQASLGIEPGVTAGWEDYWQLNASDGTGGGEAFYPDQIYSQLGAGLDGDGNVITATYATKTENEKKVTSTTLQNVVYIHNATQDSTMPFSTTPTENSIVSRDQNGDFTVNTPSADANPATKAYVDSTDESLQADITEAQSDIAALQTQTADLSQSVDDIYTILQQEVYNAQDIEQEYSSRETADGADIIDGALETVKKIQGATVKTTNLIPFPYDGEEVLNGATFTVNDDGSITVNKPTANGMTSSYYLTRQSGFNFLAGNTYTLSGGSGNAIVVISYTEDGTTKYFASDSSAVSFTWNENYIFTSMYVHIYGSSTVNNVTVYPMLNEGSSALPYMPYFSGLKNAYFKGLRSIGRNLIPFPYSDGSSKTFNGITYTVSDDGSITLNGTATSNSSYIIASDFTLYAGNYYLSGCPSGGGYSTYNLRIHTSDTTVSHADNGSGTQVNSSALNSWAMSISVESGTAVNNLVFRPMLNYGSSALPYEPYISHEISLDTAIELPAWDSIDPTTGKRIVQSNTLTFDGTESGWIFDDTTVASWYLVQYPVPNNLGFEGTSIICNKLPTNQGSASCGIYMAGLANGHPNAIYIYFVKTDFPNLNSLDAWKAQLAAWNTAGDPLTVCYQTATSTESDIEMESRLPAYKNGSETVIQGDTDNSEYGAENTLTQNYAEVKGTTGTTEGGTNS